MDDLDSSASFLVEDEPVFETFDRPASKAASRWLTKAATNADLRQIAQRFEASNQFFQKALGHLQTSLFFEVVEFLVDLSPYYWTNYKLTH